MKKVNKKKGFTLAELLVVLAILAILVAVAIPIFNGAVSNAKTTAIDANARAVRAAATTKILTDPTLSGTDGPWLATATIADDGEMTDLSVVEDGSATTALPATVAGTYKVAIQDVSTDTTP